MKKLLVAFVVGTFVMMSSGIYGVAANLRYQFDVGGHLNTAARANYIELAKKELGIALKAIEQQGLDKGSTHLCWKTTQTDLALWHGELLQLQKNINEIPTNTSYPVQTAALKTVQNSSPLISKTASQVIQPPMIEIYPHQWTLVAWNIAAVVCGVSLIALIIRLFLHLNPS